MNPVLEYLSSVGRTSMMCDEGVAATSRGLQCNPPDALGAK
jgi:hypothetical protein